MVEREVEAEVIDTATESIYFCDACGHDCDERGGHHRTRINGEIYDFCSACVEALGDQTKTLDTSLYQPGMVERPRVPNLKRDGLVLTLVTITIILVAPPGIGAIALVAWVAVISIIGWRLVFKT